MAARRKKKRNRKDSDRSISYASGHDISEFSGDGSKLKITPFASLKEQITSVTASTSPKRSRDHRAASMPLSSSRMPDSRKALSKSTDSRPQSAVKKAALNKVSDSHPVSEEEQLFLEAMEGVAPLDDKKTVAEPGAPIDRDGIPRKLDEDRQCTTELEAIIEGKKDIPVEHTPEYVEGPVINSNPRIVRKLRRGKFSVQGYCDLHGLTAKEALDWCEEFMARSITANRSCIAIIHGRGLSSPRGPVLKKMVQEWLTKGRWRRHVIAYSSAPNWDGGPGVTYVLLRQKPAPRKRRRKPKLWSE